MRDVLEQAVALGKTHTHEGAVATYIPELGKVDGSQLGVSVFCRNGKRISVGDTKVRFSIQSISKIITLAVALEICGFDQVFNMYSELVYSTGDIIDTYIYRLGLVDLKYSMASAVNLAKSAVSFILIILSYGLARKFSGYQIF